jgi:predicted nuclease of predicted toxin-antitoxin system
VGEPIKFCVDEHVPRAVTEGLRRRGVDVLTAQQAELRGATDDKYLAFAVREGRVVFTQDADFLRLHAAGQSHRGIVYASQQTSIGAIIRSLMLIHNALSSEDMVQHVEFI